MQRDWFDYILGAVQIGSLIFLIIYVVKTWQMASATRRATETSDALLKEMRDTRDQERGPHLIIYFYVPEGVHAIMLMIKNVGRSSATDIKLVFDPPLKNSGKKKVDPTKMAMITSGFIKSILAAKEERLHLVRCLSFHSR
jgi:hypothetical protein